MTTAIQPASISSELGSAMGLAFWRNYHEEQRKKADATGEAVKELSPLLALQQDPEKILKAAEAMEAEKPADEAPVSRSRSQQAKRAQDD